MKLNIIIIFIYLLYKAINNFPFINPEYIFDIYNYIKLYVRQIIISIF